MEKDFNFYVPLECYKDKNENWKIKGLASTEDRDLQGEILKQQGLDLSVLKDGKGYLNWEHKNDPKNIIGLIDNAEVTEKGLEIEGQLFSKHDQAKAVYQILESLDDSRKHRMQLSVEGKVISKSDANDGRNSKVVDKARITAVALTMNPVNTKTYAELVKSLGEVSLLEEESPSSFSSSASPLSEDQNDREDIEEARNANDIDNGLNKVIVS